MWSIDTSHRYAEATAAVAERDEGLRRMSESWRLARFVRRSIRGRR